MSNIISIIYKCLHCSLSIFIMKFIEFYFKSNLFSSSFYLKYLQKQIFLIIKKKFIKILSLFPLNYFVQALKVSFLFLNFNNNYKSYFWNNNRTIWSVRGRGKEIQKENKGKKRKKKKRRNKQNYSEYIYFFRQLQKLDFCNYFYFYSFI